MEDLRNRRETAIWKRKTVSGRKNNGNNCLLLKMAVFYRLLSVGYHRRDNGNRHSDLPDRAFCHQDKLRHGSHGSEYGRRAHRSHRSGLFYGFPAGTRCDVQTGCGEPELYDLDRSELGFRRGFHESQHNPGIVHDPVGGCVFSDEEFLKLMGGTDYLVDLRDYLPQELLDRYEDQQIKVLNTMTGETIVAGIWLEDNAWVQKTGWYEHTAAVGLADGMKTRNWRWRCWRKY